MASRRRAPNNSEIAYFNKSKEELKNKLIRTVYAITAFHITNQGILLDDKELATLRADIMKALRAGMEFGVNYHANKQE